MTEERTAQYEKVRQLQGLLQPGEQLVWHGAPANGVRLQKSDLTMIPFSLLWGGFAIFWEVSVIKTGAPFFFSLFGLPFVAIGLYMIFGRFIHDAYTRKNTYYGITNQRVILIEPKKVNSLPFHQIPTLELVLEKGDLGSVFFAPQTYQQRRGKTVINTSRPGLRLIADAPRVYNLIQSQMISHENRE